MKFEYWLAVRAETCKSDWWAKQYMRILRKFYDKTYFWCWDCDGLVTTKANCCLNQKPKLWELYDFLQNEWETGESDIYIK